MSPRHQPRFSHSALTLPALPITRAVRATRALRLTFARLARATRTFPLPITPLSAHPLALALPSALAVASVIATAVALALAASSPPTMGDHPWAAPALAQEIGDPVSVHPLYLPLVGRAFVVDDLANPTSIPHPATIEPDPTGATPDPTGPTPEPTATPPLDPSPPACPALADRVRITAVELAAPIRANDEYFPVVVAPRPGGGSLVAWREQAEPVVRVGRFDEADALQVESLAFAAEEVHALVAHEDGGALVTVAEDPDIYSPKYCRGPSTPDKAMCGKLDLVRFDDAGAERWRRTMTRKTNVDADGAHFIWWYQHTARLVWSGEHYGLYWRTAESSPRPGVPGEIDIHAADLLRFLDADGAPVDRGGVRACSHSWAVRLAFGERFASVCHGDAYPNAFRILTHALDRPSGETLLLAGMDPTKRALGGLVPRDGGFWLLYQAMPGAEMELRLAAIDLDGAVTTDIALPFATGLPTRYPFRPYLAAYGDGQLLAGWRADGELQVAVLDGETGALLEGPAAAGAEIDAWVEFVSYPNGDVGWAWSAGGTRRVEMVRVEACR